MYIWRTDAWRLTEIENFLKKIIFQSSKMASPRHMYEPFFKVREKTTFGGHLWKTLPRTTTRYVQKVRNVRVVRGRNSSLLGHSKLF